MSRFYKSADLTYQKIEMPRASVLGLFWKNRNVFFGWQTKLGVRYRLYLFFRVMCKVHKFDFYQKKITSGVLKNDILIVGERNSFKQDFLAMRTNC